MIMEVAVGEMQVRIHEDDYKGYTVMIFNFDGIHDSDNVDDEKLT